MKPYYEENGITIYHGDCCEVLGELPPVSVDVLLTDPPYGMAYTSNVTKAVTANVNSDGARQGVRIMRRAMLELAGLLKPDAHILVFCHFKGYPDFHDMLAPYGSLRNVLIWPKGTGTLGNIKADYLRDYEMVIYMARGARDLEETGDGYSAVLPVTRAVSGAARQHITEKPVDLLSRLLRRHCPPSGMVLDPFAGSGSTLVAAKRQGLRAVGIELEERYCEIAAKRLAQEVLPLTA